MRNLFEKIFTATPKAKLQPIKNNPTVIFLENEVPNSLKQLDFLKSSIYKLRGATGIGHWADVPWFAIFDTRLTTSAKEGVYIVYLLSKDSKNLYLTLNQGCTNIRATHTKKETISLLKERASNYRNKINDNRFSITPDINLGNDISELAQLYVPGVIYYKKYTLESLPSSEQIIEDLKNMVNIYKDNMELFKNTSQSTQIKKSSNIKMIADYIESKGFNYEENIIENFYTCLKSKPFVILAGTSGTGKTKLVKLFAEACGATAKNKRYKMVPVKPDWSDSSDLFGHTDLNGLFHPGVLIDFIKLAQDNPNKPYFLCLDEMNLARVEYYFSDFLSIIETREKVNDKIVTDVLIPTSYYGSDEKAINYYGEISFPENLYVIGTVNMDETTFPFSKKVLDRANTIEFSQVDLIPSISTYSEVEALDINNDYFKSKYITLKDCISNPNIKSYCHELQIINQYLSASNLQFGYRVRDEIVFYLLNSDGILDANEAWDNEIMQKILPRIQGSNSNIKTTLINIFNLCINNHSDYNDDNYISNTLENLIKDNNNVKYPKSAKKIVSMIRRFEEDGFTSFWF